MNPDHEKMISDTNHQQEKLVPLKTTPSLENTIVIVSGLPRSGTSMMMQMLAAGGLSLLTDQVRSADEDNPRGYYEYEPAKHLDDDASWLTDARGKAVKIIAPLLVHLPENPDFHYRIIFMERALPEVIASQNAMLKRQDMSPLGGSDQEMLDIFARLVAGIKVMLARKAISFLETPHREMIKNPKKMATKINRYLGGGLNGANMAAVVDKKLYRQKGKK